jgi:GMP synthase (glutamine-hydrolysing)
MDTQTFIEKQINEIKQTVGEGTAVSALSGGVDSATCTALAHRALGDRLTSLFIDDGLMRQNEPEDVRRIFGGMGIKVDIIDARDEFFAALKGLIDPEEKRVAFRNTFYTVFKREVLKTGARFLIQGTIAADIIETKGGIKTQHNILDQIGISAQQGYGYRLIEPLKELFKPGVREVCRALGLPEVLYNRMPFPGPGLATRVVGEVTPERVEIVRRATAIVEEEITPLKPFQAFAVLLSDRGTGVVEKKRRFGDIIIIRSVESENAMTAQPTQVPWDILTTATRRIIDALPSVVRVAYELTSKPPATIEYI